VIRKEFLVIDDLKSLKNKLKTLFDSQNSKEFGNDLNVRVSTKCALLSKLLLWDDGNVSEYPRPFFQILISLVITTISYFIGLENFEQVSN